MALDSRYIVSVDLQEYLVDKDTGLPLAGGIISFYSDVSRTTPKLVYQLTGAPPNYTYTPLADPIVLSAVGTTVDNDGNYTPIYYFPYDEEGNIELYYITIYSSTGVLQATLQAWPNLTESDILSNAANNVSNQLSNSQFVDIFFDETYGMIASSSVPVSGKIFNIAPDWNLVLSCSGTCSVAINRVPLEGALNIPTNPPYYLDIQPTGTVTVLQLRQKFNHNPGIFSTTTEDDGYLSGTMLITSLDGLPHTIQMQYAQSSGASAETVVAGSTLSTGFQLLSNTVLLTPSANPQDADTGYVEMIISLPIVGHIGITSLQVVGMNDDQTIVAYEQEPVNRQIDHLFHYYNPLLQFKPIKSYLVGWDFPLNPAQPFGNSKNFGVIASDYIWDQTIGWQSANNALHATRSTYFSTYGSLQISAAATAQFAVIQYLAIPEIYDLLSNPLSSNIVLSTNQANLTGTISLWYTSDSNVPNINTNHLSIIAGLTAAGMPNAFNGNWTQIQRNNYGNAIFGFGSSVDLNDLQSFGFSGWSLPDETDISAIHFVAIVIGFSSMTSGTNVEIQSCSLVPGQIPTIPAPQTAAEVLRDCQYYYEMSYGVGTVPGTATANNQKISEQILYYDQSLNTSTVFVNDFTIEYQTPKITTPAIINLYTVNTGSLNSVNVYSIGGGAFPTPTAGSNPTSIVFTTFWAIYNSNENRVTYKQATGTQVLAFTGANANIYQTAGMAYQFTADSRIGIF